MNKLPCFFLEIQSLCVRWPFSLYSFFYQVQALTFYPSFSPRGHSTQMIFFKHHAKTNEMSAHSLPNKVHANLLHTWKIKLTLQQTDAWVGCYSLGRKRRLLEASPGTWPECPSSGPLQFPKPTFHTMRHLETPKMKNKRIVNATLGNNSPEVMPFVGDLIAQGNGNKAANTSPPAAGWEIATDC